MNKASAFSFAALLSLCAIIAQDKTPAPPPELGKRIGVVDLDKVQSGHPRTAELMLLIKKREAEINQDLEDRNKKIEAKRVDLKALAQDSDEAAQLVFELRMMRNDLEQRMDAKGPRLAEMTNRLAFQLTEEIQAAVKELAKLRGLELVLRARENDLTSARGMEMAVRNHGDRDVLYYHAALDITDDVIRFLKGKHPTPEAQAKDGKTPASTEAKDANHAGPKKPTSDGKSDGK